MKLLQTVALLEENKTKGLAYGQVGTVVELLDEKTVEVEFTDEDGGTLALLTLPTDKLIPLHYEKYVAAGSS